MAQRGYIVDLGLVDYGKAWELQRQLWLRRVEGELPDLLLLLEHPHVMTLGRRGNRSFLIASPEELEKRNVPLFHVERGGDVTYHGPGQLVGYPLIPLGKVAPPPIDLDDPDAASVQVPRADYVGYVRRLEKMLITALARLGVAAAQIPRLTGVWVQPDVYSRCARCRPEDRQKPAKIAAIGVKVDSRGVSRHGFALNVQPDMTYWDGIIACGLADHPLVSLADLMDQVPAMGDIKRIVSAAFLEVFCLGTI